MHEVEKAAAVAEEAKQRLSRKKFLLGAAGIVGGGALMGVLPEAAKAHAPRNTSDEDILNYALTLEHLEAAFYVEGLKKFGREDFERAFGPRRGRGRGSGRRKFNGKQVHRFFRIIRNHEVEHVETLEGVIGANAVPPRSYNFETTAFTSIKKFISVAQFLENTGVSAYDGAIAHIRAAGLLTAGATIATVEARHASYLNLINGDVPFPDAFDEPVAPRDICRAILAENGGFVTNPGKSPYGPYNSLRAFCERLPETIN